MEQQPLTSESFVSYFGNMYDQRILISIYLLFPIILIFFFLSLRDLERLENQEKYDMTHSHYQPDVYQNLVSQWTRQGIENLKNDQQYVQWYQNKERELELKSQESSKQSIRQSQQ
ncbi:unnamed protein product (macronuclear) [Paramecium tetraurelia]|uniref:Uncharacterized protein n=1 Tax=Paramecium tetraurelia TaxID=5888 RepID=A0CHI4_PARTE|nr:uncharacterized protein GSPATT00038353001 [Paramecium tetraurelia]CAK70251.1 unnamed protein product [Paramecium tetraurelia]|eukprot:XP_001437648.1 hypothetical protein (macronuclear) [Paramecium tetraurelia strain d4-2]